MKLIDLKKYKISENPGVYYFFKGENILYIGKATNLKDRIRSYFSKDLIATRGPLLVDMIFKADKIKWEETDSVLEALILEASEIKKYQPYYNTKEKDDKSFNYVYITKDYKLGIIRGKELKKNFANFLRTFGPFPNGGQLREALKIIRKFFPYIEDRKGAKGKEEFYKQIKLLPENNEENKKNIKNIILFFQGKKKRIISNLKKEMKVFAKNKEFEKAQEIKKKIFALEHINDIALIKEDIFKQNHSLRRSHSILEEQEKSGRSEYSSENDFVNKRNFFELRNMRIEAYDVAHMSGKNMVGVMVVLEGGELVKNKYRKFSAKGGSAFGGRTVLGNNKANDTGALKEILERRFNHKEWEFPEVIIVDGGLQQINIAKRFLEENNLNIKVLSVLKNEKHKPKNILGDKTITQKYEKEILLANSEAHRFAIKYHKQLRNKNFLR